VEYTFDAAFQRQMLNYVLTSGRVDIVDMMDDRYFDEFEAKELVKYLKEKVPTGKFPPLNVILAECGGIFLSDSDMTTQKKKIIEFIDAVTTSKPVDAISDLVVDFLKTQGFRRTLLTMETDYQSGTTDIGKYMKELGILDSISMTKDMGIIYSQTPELSVALGEKMPTHLPTLNNWLKGGLAKREMGIIVGPAKVGKTFFAANIAAFIYELGRVVFYYTMELSKEVIKLRLDTRISGYTEEEITGKHSKFLEKFGRAKKGGEIVIQDYPPSTMGVLGMMNHMRLMHDTANLYPDVVIVDFLDLVKPSYRTENDWQNMMDVVMSLSMMAKQSDVALWTLTHTKKQDYKDRFTLDDLGRTVEKAKLADIVIGLLNKDSPNESRGLVEVFLLAARRAAKSNGRYFKTELDYERGYQYEVGSAAPEEVKI
jgi:archaellum biogenesis ATPase FlaH